MNIFIKCRVLGVLTPGLLLSSIAHAQSDDTQQAVSAGLPAQASGLSALSSAEAPGGQHPAQPELGLLSSGLTSPPSTPNADGGSATKGLPDIASMDVRAKFKAALKFCTSEDAVQDRIACYDDLARSNGLKVHPASGAYHQPTQVGNFVWAEKTSTTPDGKSEAIAGLATADVHFSDDVQKKGEATLFLRCLAGKSSMYVTFDSPVSPTALPVSVSTQDSGQAGGHTYMWGASKSGQSLGLWEDAQSRVFSSFLVSQPFLKISIQQPDGRVIKAAFNLNGLPTAISPVRSLCGW